MHSKYGKINQKIETSQMLTVEARGQRDPPISETKTGDGVDRQELADGEVSDGSVFTVALFSAPRIDW